MNVFNLLDPATRPCRYAVVVVISLVALLPSTALAECNVDGSRKWKHFNNIEHPVYLKHGCLAEGENSYSYTAIAFLPHLTAIEFVGSSNGKPPGFSEIFDEATEAERFSKHTLAAVHSDKANHRYFAMAPIGYPVWHPGLVPAPQQLKQKDRRDPDLWDRWLTENVDEDWLILSGFLRFRGRVLYDRDPLALFKSVFFCPFDRSKVPDGEIYGSLPIMFSAVEEGILREPSISIQDRSICNEAIQVGPRVVEYSAKEGINTDTAPQRWLIFAQGNGNKTSGYQDEAEFFAYLIYFEDRVRLSSIQAHLLEDFALSDRDAQMKYAFALTSDNFADLSYTLDTGIVETARGAALPHPVFLGLRPLQ